MIYSLITATNCRENKGIPCLKYVYVLCAKIFSHWKSRKTTKQKNKIEKLKIQVIEIACSVAEGFVKIGAEIAVKTRPPHCLVFSRTYPRGDPRRLVTWTAVKHLNALGKFNPSSFSLSSHIRPLWTLRISPPMWINHFHSNVLEISLGLSKGERYNGVINPMQWR